MPIEKSQFESFKSSRKQIARYFNNLKLGKMAGAGDPRASLPGLVLFALLWTECSSFGITTGTAPASMFARRAAVHVLGELSVLAAPFQGGRSGSRQSAASTVTCSGKGNAESPGSKMVGAGSSIAALGRRFRVSIQFSHTCMASILTRRAEAHAQKHMGRHPHKHLVSCVSRRSAGEVLPLAPTSCCIR